MNQEKKNRFCLVGFTRFVVGLHGGFHDGVCSEFMVRLVGFCNGGGAGDHNSCVS